MRKQIICMLLVVIFCAPGVAFSADQSDSNAQITDSSDSSITVSDEIKPLQDKQDESLDSDKDESSNDVSEKSEIKSNEKSNFDDDVAVEENEEENIPERLKSPHYGFGLHYKISGEPSLNGQKYSSKGFGASLEWIFFAPKYVGEFSLGTDFEFGYKKIDTNVSKFYAVDPSLGYKVVIFPTQALIPYANVGYSYRNFSALLIDTRTQLYKTAFDNGNTTGAMVKFGLMLNLNNLEPSAAGKMYSSMSIKRSLLFFEYKKYLGNSVIFDFPDAMMKIGLKFEF